MTAPRAFETVTYPEPHLERTRAILKAHPEVKQLFGQDRSSMFWILGIVAGQVGIAVALRHQPWWAILAAAWLVGAFADHALWTLIHDCTHNLVLRRPRDNAFLALVANLPIVFPSASSFRKYHLIHHRFQGDVSLDADLPMPIEARMLSGSMFGKTLWMLTFFLWQALRVSRIKSVKLWDRWYVLNVALQVAFVGAMFAAGGWMAVLYLTLSSIFAVGLHPVGARWIQEHYLTMPQAPNQETFSYYGPLNVVAFNVGYHNEHHDLMMVPWSRLPQLKAIAPEFYDSLAAHKSWTALLLRFIADPKLSLYSRRTRQSTVRTVKVPAANETHSGPENIVAPAEAA